MNQNKRRTHELITHGFKNCVKCSHGIAESRQHRIKKFQVASYCWEKGLTFSTEAQLNNKSRADIVVHDWAVAIEILDSEGIKSVNLKKEKYPLEVIAVSCRQPIKKTMEMLQELFNTNGSASDYYSKKIQM